MLTLVPMVMAHNHGLLQLNMLVNLQLNILPLDHIGGRTVSHRNPQARMNVT